MTSQTPLLLPSQKADVTRILEMNELSPADFQWVEKCSEESGDGFAASSIKHRREDYYCFIDRSSGGTWIVERCPGAEEWINKGTGSHWERMCEYVSEWAGFVARELKAKEYLEIAMNSPTLLQAPADDEENSTFTINEQEQLVVRLNLIEEHLLEYQQDADDFHVEVRRAFEVLRDEVARSGRTAFRFTLFSILASLGLHFLEPDQTKEILAFAADQIGTITQLITNTD